MDVTDIIINKIENDYSSKSETNILVGFSNKEIGRVLGGLIDKIITNRPGQCSVTILNLLTPETANAIEDINVYQSNLYSDINLTSESNKVTIRTFAKKSEDFIEDIINAAEEHKSDTIFYGVCPKTYSPELWDEYIRLKRENNIFDEDIYTQALGQETTKVIQSISTLVNRSEYSTGIFISNRKQKEFNKIFTIILKDSDLYSLPLLSHLARCNDIEIVIWDAIGILNSNQSLKKALNTMSRKNDARINIWNNKKKIENEFILAQDLIIIGSDGWEQLIITPLSWIKYLPSVLIIKD